MFNYLVRVHPHHTDYAGNVWHGTYITWLEEVRVECLRSQGISFAQLVGAGVDLPVIDLALHYHQAIKMGENLLITTKLSRDRLRLTFNYELKVEDRLCTTGSVTLVGVDTQTRKVLRKLPDYLEAAIAKLIDD